VTAFINSTDSVSRTLYFFSIFLTDESLSKYPSPFVILVLDFVSPKIVLSLLIAVFGAALVAFGLATVAS
jgi:hypothetical protein